MNIKNYQLSNIIELLSELTLKGHLSRRRTKFLHLLIDAYQEFILAEQKLKEEFAVKDSDGNIIFKDENNSVFEVTMDYLEEHSVLANENFVVEANETHRDMLTTVANILLEGEFDVSGETATYYNEWCEELEKVLEYYSEDK